MAADVLDSGNPSGELVAHYRFDEGAGDVAYDYSNGTQFDRKLQNVNFNTESGWKDGKIGSSIRFDGENDYAHTNRDNAAFEVDKVSVSAWVKYRDSPAGGNGNFAEKVVEKGKAPNVGYTLKKSADGQDMVFEIRNGSEKFNITTSGPSIKDGDWHHIVGAYDGSRIKIYSDGQFVNTETVNEDISYGNDRFVIGAESDQSGGHFNGSIDDLRIYSAALNHSQVKSLYNQGSGLRSGKEENETGGKVLDIDFDRKNSTHVFDTSGNQNHGTPENGAAQELTGYCKEGRCYSFDGQEDHVSVSDDSSLSPTGNKLTLSAWVYSEGTTGRGDQIVRKTQADATDYTYNIRLQGPDNTGGTSTRRVRLEFEDGSGTVHKLYSDKRVPKKSWTHVAGVINGSGSTKIYVDGIENNSSSISFSSFTKNDNDLSIGSEIGGDSNKEYFNGRIDEVKVFDRALTQKEIIKEAGIKRDGAVLDLESDSGAGDTAYDSSRNGNDGTLKPNESEGPQWVDGVQGGALEFDGSNDRIDWSGQGDTGESISFSVWVKPSSLSGRNQIIYWGEGSNPQFELFDTNTANGGDIAFIYYVSANNNYGFQKDTTDTFSLKTGDWQHLVGTYDDTTGVWKLYLNGELKDQKTDPADPEFSGADNTIGKHPNQDDQWQWDGKIDQVKVYPYALSQSRIKSLYRQGSSHIGERTTDAKPPQSPGDDGLLVEQNFENVNSTHALDTSGNNQHGLRGSSTVTAGKCLKGRCQRFDDTNEKISITDPQAVGSSVTIAGWVYRIGADSKQGWLDYADYTSGIPKFMANAFGDVKVEYWNETSDGNFLKLNGGSEKGSWMFLATKYNGTHGFLYKNGQQVDLAKFPWAGSPSGDSTKIGMGDNNDLNGLIDQVHIYNRSLSDQEMWSLYTQGRDQLSTGEIPGPSISFRLNAENGQKIFDFSGENLDGSRGQDLSVESADPERIEQCWSDRCLNLSGSGEYATGPEPVVSDQITMSVWANSEVQNADRPLIYLDSNARFSSNDAWVGIRYDSSGFDTGVSNNLKISMRDSEGDAARWETVSNVQTSDKWTHWVITYNADESTPSLFKNGEKVEIAGSGGNPSSVNSELAVNSLQIGIGPTPGGAPAYWKGSIDDVRIYPYALTGKQVKQLHKRGGTSIR